MDRRSDTVQYCRGRPVTISKKLRARLPQAAGIASGVLALVLYCWTPVTAEGIRHFRVGVILLVILILAMAGLSLGMTGERTPQPAPWTGEEVEDSEDPTNATGNSPGT